MLFHCRYIAITHSSILHFNYKFNCGHSGLQLPITWSKKNDDTGTAGGNNYVQDSDNIAADGCLEFVQDKLLHFLDTLHDNGLIELHKIVWDWRRSFEEAEHTITTTIESVCTKNYDSNGRKSIILSHSTGAMLVWPTISRNPEWFQTWINAAGCLLIPSSIFLAEFVHGWSMGFPKLLSEDVFFTCPGLYSYFPTTGEKNGGGAGGYFISPDGTYHPHDDIDLHDIAVWEQYKFGIFALKQTITDEEREHLTHCLDTAKRFRETNLVRGGNKHDPSFLHKDPSAYNHLHIVCYGQDKNDTHLAYELNKEEKTLDITESKVKTKGDGTLMIEQWQTIPGGLKRDIVIAEEGSNHVSLVNDKRLQGVLLEAFYKGDDLKKKEATSLLQK